MWVLHVSQNQFLFQLFCLLLIAWFAENSTNLRISWCCWWVAWWLTPFFIFRDDCEWSSSCPNFAPFEREFLDSTLSLIKTNVDASLLLPLTASAVSEEGTQVSPISSTILIWTFYRLSLDSTDSLHAIKFISLEFFLFNSHHLIFFIANYFSCFTCWHSCTVCHFKVKS